MKQEKEPKYAYCVVADSTEQTGDAWVSKAREFLDYLASGYEIISCKATHNSVHYILRKGGQ